MKHDDKRQLRQIKRLIKRAGNKSRRQHLKRELTTNPEDAPDGDFDFGRRSSQALNGLDADATRRRPGRGQEQKQTDAEPEEGVTE